MPKTNNTCLEVTQSNRTHKLTKLECYVCGTEIMPYYHKGYKGERGRCKKCNSDFPLE
ncbi:MAG: hypothetical protein KC483_07740 [Nitrosarchaeum sp.]|nr:hypothetical protein [Nitrosarchaeum sp.]